MRHVLPKKAIQEEEKEKEEMLYVEIATITTPGSSKEKKNNDRMTPISNMFGGQVDQKKNESPLIDSNSLFRQSTSIIQKVILRESINEKK